MNIDDLWWSSSNKWTFTILFRRWTVNLKKNTRMHEMQQNKIVTGNKFKSEVAKQAQDREI